MRKFHFYQLPPQPTRLRAYCFAVLGSALLALGVVLHASFPRPSAAAPEATAAQEAAPESSKVRFILIDADRDEPVKELRDGEELNLAELPTKRLNIDAQFAGGNPQSVTFQLNEHKRYRQETAPPFALAGNRGPDFNPWTPRPGEYTIEVTTQRGGKSSSAGVLRLKIIDDEKKASAARERGAARAQLAASPPQTGRTAARSSDRSSDRPAQAESSGPAAAAKSEKAGRSGSRSAPARTQAQAANSRNIIFQLEAAQTSPPSGSTAMGKCVAITNQANHEVNIVCTHTVTRPSSAHLYQGEPKRIGEPLCDLGHPASPIVQRCVLTEGQFAELRKGRLYVQINSESFPAGELRGQVR